VSCYSGESLLGWFLLDFASSSRCLVLTNAPIELELASLVGVFTFSQNKLFGSSKKRGWSLYFKLWRGSSVMIQASEFQQMMLVMIKIGRVKYFKVSENHSLSDKRVQTCNFAPVYSDWFLII